MKDFISYFSLEINTLIRDWSELVKFYQPKLELSDFGIGVLSTSCKSNKSYLLLNVESLLWNAQISNIIDDNKYSIKVKDWKLFPLAITKTPLQTLQNIKSGIKKVKNSKITEDKIYSIGFSKISKPDPFSECRNENATESKINNA